MSARVLAVLVVVAAGLLATLLGVARGSRNDVALPASGGAIAPVGTPETIEVSGPVPVDEATSSTRVLVPASSTPSVAEEIPTEEVPFDGLALYGKVVASEGGAPIAGATVEIVPNEFGNPEPIAHLETDEEGRYRLGELREVEALQVRAHAPGYVRQSQVQTTGTYREIELERGLVLSGRVLSASDRRPIADVPIWSPSASWNWTDVGGVLARTGSDGSFRITGLPRSGSVRLMIQPPDWVRIERDLQTAETDIVDYEILVDAAAKLTLKLVDDRTGAPLVGLVGRLMRAPFSDQRSPASSFRTDAEGMCVLSVARDGLQLRRRGMVVLTDDFSPASFRLKPDLLEEPVELRLRRRSFLEGVVQDRYGNPLGGVRVERRGLIAAPGPSDIVFGEGSIVSRHVTDATGAFRFEVPPRGAFDALGVRTQKSGWCAETIYVRLPVPGETRSIDLFLRRSATVTGSALDGDRPFHGVLEAANGDWEGSSPINDRGRFVLRDVLPGDVQLGLVPESDPSSQTHRGPVYRGDVSVGEGESVVHDIQVGTGESRWIRGRVITHAGLPIEGAFIELVRRTERDGRLRTGRFGITDRSAQDGSFELELGGTIGPYTVTAQLDTITVREDHVGEGAEIELVFPPQGQIRLRPTPIGGEVTTPRLDHVRWWPSGTSHIAPSIGLQRSVAAAADGTFPITLPAGTWDVEFQPAEAAYVRVDGIMVRADETVEQGFELKSGVTLSVRLDFGADPPPDSFSVRLSGETRTGPEGYTYPIWSRSLDSETEQTFKRVSPGWYSVLWMREDWSIENQVFEVPEVPEHEIVIRCRKER